MDLTAADAPIARIQTSLAGESPRARHAARVTRLYQWLLLWHYAPTSVLSEWLGYQRRQYPLLRKLTSKRKIQTLNTGYREAVWMLTHRGLGDARLVDVQGVADRYQTKGYRVPHAFLPHNIVCQRAALQLVTDPARQVVIPARLIHDTIKPDFLIDDDAYEIELSAKKDPAIENRLARLAEQIDYGDYAHVHWLFCSSAIKQLYERIFARDVWHKRRKAGDLGVYVSDGVYRPDDHIRARITFQRVAIPV